MEYPAYRRDEYEHADQTVDDGRYPGEETHRALHHRAHAGRGHLGEKHGGKKAHGDTYQYRAAGAVYAREYEGQDTELRLRRR